MNAVLQPMHPDEWKARVQLAACYRIFDMLGWAEMIYNHITVRLPDSVTGGAEAVPDQPVRAALLRGHGQQPAEDRRAGQQARCAQPVAGEPGRLHHPRGDPRGLPDAHCVMHTHTTAGLAVACTEGGLAQNNFYSAQLHDMVAYHDFEGITIHADEAPRLLASMGTSRW
jgi:ribulose-5-phosphate 4-epimerase/fuculose-1-phosphate aldolase